MDTYSFSVKVPKDPTPEEARRLMLATLEAWEWALDNGYRLTIEREGADV